MYTEQLLRQLRDNGKAKSIRDLLEDTQLAVSHAKPDQRPKVFGDTAMFRDVGLAGPMKVASLGLEVTGRLGVDPEHEAWQAAKVANSAAAYDAYLADYPRGKFVSAAQAPLSPQGTTACGAGLSR